MSGAAGHRGPPSGFGPARLHAVVRGQVQGVGFRYFVRREALRLRLTGWVANRADGSVECTAEGDRGGLEQFVELLTVGPRGASVHDVAVDWGLPGDAFDAFSVRTGSHPGD